MVGAIVLLTFMVPIGIVAGYLAGWRDRGKHDAE
jgi:hypothetical protein